MAELSITGMAFAGFGLIKREPVAVLIWSALLLVFLALFFGALFAIAAPEVIALLRAESSGSGETAVEGVFTKILPVYLLGLLAGVAWYLSMIGAVLRAMLRPKERRFGYLRLGGDELRLLALTLIYVVMFAAAAIVLVLVIGAATAAAAASGDETMQGVAALIAVLLGICSVCAWFYVAIRLSLAMPMTFAERRIRLFESWSLTRGRFWPIFAALLLAIVVSTAVSYGGQLAAMMIFMVGGGGLMAANSAAMSADPMAALGAMWPALLLIGLIGGGILIIVQVVNQVLLVAPYAEAYRTLKPDAAEAAETFA